MQMHDDLSASMYKSEERTCSSKLVAKMNSSLALAGLLLLALTVIAKPVS